MIWKQQKTLDMYLIVDMAIFNNFSHFLQFLCQG